MKAIQALAIRKAIHDGKRVSITGAEYEGGKRKQIFSGKEIDRLFKSDDFKLGWRLAQEQIGGVVSFLLSAKDSDLKRYLMGWTVEKGKAEDAARIAEKSFKGPDGALLIVAGVDIDTPPAPVDDFRYSLIDTRFKTRMIPVAKDKLNGRDLYILGIKEGEWNLSTVAIIDVAAVDGSAALAEILKALPWKASIRAQREMTEAIAAAKIRSEASAGAERIRKAATKARRLGAPALAEAILRRETSPESADRLESEEAGRSESERNFNPPGTMADNGR